MWWSTIQGGNLAQGDLLPECLLPHFSEPPVPTRDGTPTPVKRATLIVASQSCDLVNAKIEFVALCPVHTLLEFELTNTHFTQKGNWERVRRGDRPALHLLASPTEPLNNRSSLVVDFGQIVSVPFGYLTKHATSLGNRHRLSSPYLEHFSQSFARFFMRVGLPSSIEPFRVRRQTHDLR